MYRHAEMFTTYPKTQLQFDEQMTLTEDEVRHELAHRIAVLSGCPTRVRAGKVEILYGDVWAEHRPIVG